MGGGGMLITLISPTSPVSNRAGESRTFKASVNMDNPIVRWKLDGVLVQAAMNLPANTEMSFTANAVAGIHELKIEAEKNGVLVSKSWIWNVDELISSSSNSYMSDSGNVYVKIKNATLYQKTDGTYSVDVEWSAHGCTRFNDQNLVGYKKCETVVTIRVTWNLLTLPGGSDPYQQIVHRSDLCTISGSDRFDGVSRPGCSITITLKAKCWRIGLDNDCTIGAYLAEDGSCSCNL